MSESVQFQIYNLKVRMYDHYILAIVQHFQFARLCTSTDYFAAFSNILAE